MPRRTPRDPFGEAAPAPGSVRDTARTDLYASTAPLAASREEVRREAAYAPVSAVAAESLPTRTEQQPVAHHAALSGDSDLLDRDEEEDELDDLSTAAEAEVKGGLLSSLSRRFAPQRKAHAPARQEVDPSPSLDAAEMLAPDMSNELLEPGSGLPDVKRILERVRAGQREGAKPADLEDGDRVDHIAAARRAAKLAAEEAGTIRAEQAGDRAEPAKKKSSRRPILLAVGAVLLAVLSYPLVNTMINGESAPPKIEATAQPAAAESAPAETAMTPAEEPAAAATLPAETPAKAETTAPAATAEPAQGETSQNLAPETDAAASPPCPRRKHRSRKPRCRALPCPQRPWRPPP